MRAVNGALQPDGVQRTFEHARRSRVRLLIGVIRRDILCSLVPPFRESWILAVTVVRLKRWFATIPTEMGGRDRKRPPPTVTYFLLAFTILLQLYISTLPEAEAMELYEAFSLVPVHFLEGLYLDTTVTYMFLHGSLMHLLVNSIALYGAGSIVERDIGSLKFLLVFLLSGLIAGAMHCYLNPNSSIPLVGSSGAIFGIIAVMFLLMPFKLTLALMIPLPSVIVGLILIAVELSAFWMPTDVGIAHDAHLSGFIMGGICAFGIDKKRAIKGVLIAAAILALIYLLGVYLNLMNSFG